jgi:hypothetical protein
MSSDFDPRSDLVRTKYFSLHPKPLERWLWQQGLPQAAERVFWLHWEAGMRNGDWCSEIPLKRVATECAVDPSTVTRAYQLLKTKSLIRREDPGRDPNNPFCQATAITEVRLPREFLTELGRSPNRPPSAGQRGEAVANSAPTIASAASLPLTSNGAPTRNTRRTRKETQDMWSRASAAEQSRYFIASRDRLTALEFDPDTQLTPQDRGYLLAELAQLAAARPSPAMRANPPAKAAPKGPRRLSVLDLARARRQILSAIPGPNGHETLRQVVWAVEEGALHRFALQLALNIALKKVREGAWTRPHRMPPNWHPLQQLSRAVSEHCSAA